MTVAKVDVAVAKVAVTVARVAAATTNVAKAAIFVHGRFVITVVIDGEIDIERENGQ